MANTTATWYRDGAQQSGGYVGCVGYDGYPVVGRFQFTTPATGASGFSFQSDGLAPAGQTTWQSPTGPDNFRYAITTSSTAHTTKCGTDGNAVGVDWDHDPKRMDSSGTASVQLMPSTTYYLWIYPATSAYNLWRITGISVTLTGAYGNPASPTASDGNFGAAVGITLTGGSSGATYTVTASCAGRTETLQNKGTSTYLTWIPALATYGPLVPSAASAAATITVETFYGSTSRGTSHTSITLSFRAADVSPTVSNGWYSHAPYNESAGSGINKYIQGISKARFSFDSSKISTMYGATIASYSVTVGSATDSASPYETPILNGSTAVTVKVTDSRGFSYSTSVTITPLSYAAPTLGQVSIFRCDQSGTADENGQYCCATASAVFSDLEGSNSASMRLYVKIASGSSWGNGVPMQSGVSLINGGLDPDSVYDALIEIQDALGNTGRVLSRIPSRVWAMRFRESGKGVAFGMSPQADQRIEIPAGWSIVIGSTALSESDLQALKALLT